jgi:hypothetical protein
MHLLEKGSCGGCDAAALTIERQQNQALFALQAAGGCGLQKSVPTLYPPHSENRAGSGLAERAAADQVAAEQDANDRGRIAAA